MLCVCFAIVEKTTVLDTQPRERIPQRENNKKVNGGKNGHCMRKQD